MSAGEQRTPVRCQMSSDKSNLQKRVEQLEKKQQQLEEGAIDAQGRKWSVSDFLNMGLTRRQALSAIGAMAAGATLGTAIRESIGTASAAASDTDSDGDIGTPSDRVDIFAEGIDANSVNTQQVNDIVFAEPGDDLNAKATSAAGGILVLEEGTYTDPDIQLKGETILRGMGRNGTNIERTVDRPVVSTVGAAGTGYEDIIISDFKLKDKTDGATTYPVEIVNGMDVKIRDCEFDGEPLSTQSDITGVDVSANSYSNTFHVKIENNLFRQASINYGAGMTNCSIRNNIVWADNRPFGIAIRNNDFTIAENLIVSSSVNGGLYSPGNITRDVRVIGNFFDGSYDANTSGNGIQMTKLYSSTIVGNSFWNNSKSGIQIEDSLGNVIGLNEFRENNKADAGHSDIEIESTAFASFKNTLVGNTHWSNRSGQTNPGYPVALVDNGGGAPAWTRISQQVYDPANYAGYVDDSAAIRTIINGWGENAGDPNTTGQWSGMGQPGIGVVDTTNGAKYVYRGGTWV